MSVFQKHPELLKFPDYDHKRYPSAFEDALLMVLEQNHLYAKRTNLQDPYEIDFAIRRTDNDELQFYVEAEYDASGRLFTKDGDITYPNVNIPSRKYKYFNKDKPTVYVKGSKDLKWVLVLEGSHIIRFGKESTVSCTFNKGKIRENDKLIQVEKQYAKERLALLTGSLQDWLKLAKKLRSFQNLVFTEANP